MDKQLDQFWAAAKKVQMTATERKHAKQTMENRLDTLPVLPVVAVAKGVEMTRSEKKAGKQALQDLINSNPAKLPKQKVSLWSMPLFGLRLSSMAMVAVLAFTATGGGVVYASDSALPGDTLYVVKTNIREPLGGCMKWRRKDRAQWEKDRMEKRFGEMRQLLQRGELTEEHRMLISERMQHHTKRMEEHLNKLEDVDGADEMRAHLVEALEKHEQVLSGLEDGTTQPQELRTFLHDLRKHKEEFRKNMPKEMRHELRPHRPGGRRQGQDLGGNVLRRERKSHP